MSSSVPSSATERPIPKHLQDLQSFLSKTISEVGRAVLRSSDGDLADMHADNFHLHLFLYSYFKKKSIEQRKIDAIAIDGTTARILLHNVLLPSLAGGPSAKKYTQLDVATAGRTEYYPLVPQRTLREMIAGQKVVLDAFSEVVEACGHVDAVQGHKKAGFGVVNVLHFVAIAITLVPTDGVHEMLSMVLDDADLPLAVKYKIVFIWSLIDTANADVLRGVCASLLGQAAGGGYAYVDIASLPRMVMGGPISAGQAGASRQPADQPTAQPVAQSSEYVSTVPSSAPAYHSHASAEAAEGDAEGAPLSQKDGPRVVYHGAEDADGGGEEHNPCTDEVVGTDKKDADDFWARLAS